MRTVYQAANAVEAHMLCDLLKQQGITAQIHGEALQGAIGELPAAGLVRLVVDETDYTQARELVERWDAEQPAYEREKPPATKSRSVTIFLLGLAMGVGATFAYVRTPVRLDGIDHNHDGVLDETWTYSARGTLVNAEIDRNLDGKVDYIAYYDARGEIEAADADDDFDGIFETSIGFRQGNVQLIEVDTHGDRFRDLRLVFVHGVMASAEYLDPANGKPLRVEHFKLGKMVDADVDTDRDGVLETHISYSPLGEVVGTVRR